MIQAIDYKTGKVRWSHKWETNVRSGLLSTAGNLVFTGGSSSEPRGVECGDRRSRCGMRGSARR